MLELPWTTDAPATWLRFAPYPNDYAREANQAWRGEYEVFDPATASRGSDCDEAAGLGLAIAILLDAPAEVEFVPPDEPKHILVLTSFGRVDLTPSFPPRQLRAPDIQPPICPGPRCTQRPQHGGSYGQGGGGIPPVYPGPGDTVRPWTTTIPDPRLPSTQPPATAVPTATPAPAP